ncbi:TIGR03619 family F420-dependent LLM class oxidoreductase [Amycolatopsis magusensis]|uniref:TIGR03619 family F420-dependent LLM class oxidoreductase n=1 Tax=Amycolatopsis magusensis TaxID=882444 RepID=UPI0024A843FC|nr:TIGR03619 family F420-dependent LLM class oxidoreductase [Amycolatopsis magusensis]MDI5980030.1 TIGR03619 family F420-dependent LLM class oxidoreductase [Amycolatopsis magusensis]
MRIGVNVPNFGPGTDPGQLRAWAQLVEGLGYDLLMVSDHLVITPDVAEQYPPPFYEPFTTLSWLAGLTSRVRLGTTVLLAPYRHPLLTARMAANLNEFSGGRLVLGMAVGWARQEFAALDVPYERRGKLTDDYLRAMREAWENKEDYRTEQIPLWIGGNSDAGIRRAARRGDAWHPLRNTIPWLRDGLVRLGEAAAVEGRPAPAFAPRIILRLTDAPIEGPERLAGEGTIEQIVGDLEELRRLGAETVVLDPFGGDPEETRHPQTAWHALAAVADNWELTR